MLSSQYYGKQAGREGCLWASELGLYLNFISHEPCLILEIEFTSLKLVFLYYNLK